MEVQLCGCHVPGALTLLFQLGPVWMVGLPRNSAPIPACKAVDMLQLENFYRQHCMKIFQLKARGIVGIIWIVMFEKWIKEENNASVRTTRQKQTSKIII